MTAWFYWWVFGMVCVSLGWFIRKAFDISGETSSDAEMVAYDHGFKAGYDQAEHDARCNKLIANANPREA